MKRDHQMHNRSNQSEILLPIHNLLKILRKPRQLKHLLKNS